MEAQSTLPAGSLKDVLGLLRSLYAAICVDEDASFLRYGYLSTENASAVRKEVPKLCAELRPHALALNRDRCVACGESAASRRSRF
ncbi:putative acyl-coenzyme A oxidase At3g06690 [Cajanus cajan]|uniref:putative acyl-coenzyme A oxidase At3g06690 n=1 Tax=Cajanus cajan TaxID=3821 RepID=UPI00098DA637|nr:putative acyl-coenzyme A oxidase At3g06690 [Cajanus cajan]